MVNDIAPLVIHVVTAALTIMWLPNVMFGFDPFGLFGGSEIAVMLATVLALVAVFDILEIAGVVCYP